MTEGVPNAAQFVGIYVSEASQRVDGMMKLLGQISARGENLTEVETLARYAHSVKGMSLMMGYDKLSAVAARMENILQAHCEGRTQLDPQTLKSLDEAVAFLATAIEEIARGSSPSAS